MGPYEESEIEVLSIRDSVHKRPAMYFGDLNDGSAYAGIIKSLVQAILSWQIGANLTVVLKTDNAAELYCYSGLPHDEKPFEVRGCRPLHFITRKVASFNFDPLGSQLLALTSIACSQMHWEIRDQFGETSAALKDGICEATFNESPFLPRHLCVRVTLTIGTKAIHVAPAPLDKVARALRYMSGPADAGYWGCVSIRDQRADEKETVLVTNPPPGPY